jgi:hypothetical protein
MVFLENGVLFRYDGVSEFLPADRLDTARCTSVHCELQCQQATLPVCVVARYVVLPLDLWSRSRGFQTVVRAPIGVLLERFLFRSIWGPHGGEYEDDRLLGCSDVQSGRSLPTMTHRPDDGGSKDLWNDGKLLPDYTALQPKDSRLRFSLPNFLYSNIK